jgi:hypothetical protein
MKVAVVSSRRQITLTKDELERLGVAPNGKVVKAVSDGVIYIKPLKTSIVDQTAGSLTKYVANSKKGVSFEEIIKQTKNITSKKLAQNS